MLTNETRRSLLNRAKAVQFPGSIMEVYKAAEQGIDVLAEHEAQMQQQPQVAQTSEQQEVGLREEHAQGNTQASMAFPDVQPNQSFNTVGMKAPIDIQKIDDQGHLVESYKNVPPGIQDLPTGPNKGTVIESPAAYQKGGFEEFTSTNYTKDQLKNKNSNNAPWEVKKGVRAVESSNGINMINKTSSATGLYGQLFNEIKDLPELKNISREQFAADTTLQNKIFDMRWQGKLPDIPGLKNNAKMLQKKYPNQSKDYSLNELASISNFVGRKGSREYFASIRDNTPFTVPGVNKTPEEYIEGYRTAVKKNKRGGYKQKYQTGGEGRFKIDEEFEKEKKKGTIAAARQRTLLDTFRPPGDARGEIRDAVTEFSKKKFRNRFNELNPHHGKTQEPYNDKDLAIQNIRQSLGNISPELFNKILEEGKNIKGSLKGVTGFTDGLKAMYNLDLSTAKELLKEANIDKNIILDGTNMPYLAKKYLKSKLKKGGYRPKYL